jgi:hypothetical protein
MSWRRTFKFAPICLVVFLAGGGICQSLQTAGQLLPKATAADSEAQFQLGLLYQRGSLTTPKDEAKAFGWFQKSALQGNPKGENALGIAYAHGFGVTEDPKNAFEWFYKAALKGNAAAQHNLAALYRSGRGTPKNESIAFDWTLKAALNGEMSSQLLLCSTYQKPSSGEEDLTMAYAWCLISQAPASSQAKSHFSEKQIELLRSHSAQARDALSPSQLREATALASAWQSGHSLGVTLPRHSRAALESDATHPGNFYVAEGPSKFPERKKTYVRSNGCETGHWIDSVLSDGEIVKLEDGTIWRVDSADTVDSALWLDTEDVTVCDGKLINTDDKSSVEAHQIH